MKKLGFSLVEMMVVIVVVALLATMMVFFVSNWRTDIAETEVKSDLTNASNAAEDYNNFNSTYPKSQAVFNTIYTNTDTVTMTYEPRGSLYGTRVESYCLNARSTERSNVRWYIDSSVGTTPRSGTC